VRYKERIRQHEGTIHKKNKHPKSKKENTWYAWNTISIPALGRQRQAEFCEFKASLVYIARSRLVRAV